jgi:hypothetical protein
MTNIRNPIDMTIEAKVMIGFRKADHRSRRRRRLIASANSGAGGSLLVLVAAMVDSSRLPAP